MRTAFVFICVAIFWAVVENRKKVDTPVTPVMKIDTPIKEVKTKIKEPTPCSSLLSFDNTTKGATTTILDLADSTGKWKNVSIWFSKEKEDEVHLCLGISYLKGGILPPKKDKIARITLNFKGGGSSYIECINQTGRLIHESKPIIAAIIEQLESLELESVDIDCNGSTHNNNAAFCEKVSRSIICLKDYAL